MLKSCIFRSRTAIRRITDIRFRLPGPETERREAAGRASGTLSADRLDPEDAGRNGTGDVHGRITRDDQVGGASMPLFLIERNFAEKLEASAEGVGRTIDVNKDVGVHWLFSFLRADERKTYCLYEAPSAVALREAARRLGLPGDAITEVSELNPAEFLSREELERRSGRGPTRSL
jgi:hypothetical protein